MNASASTIEGLPLTNNRYLSFAMEVFERTTVLVPVLGPVGVPPVIPGDPYRVDEPVKLLFDHLLIAEQPGGSENLPRPAFSCALRPVDILVTLSHPVRDPGSQAWDERRTYCNDSKIIDDAAVRKSGIVAETDE